MYVRNKITQFLLSQYKRDIVMKFNKELFCVTHYQPSHCLTASRILYNYERSKQCLSSIGYHLFFNTFDSFGKKIQQKIGK